MPESGDVKPLALLVPGLDGTGRFFDNHVTALATRYRVRAWEFRRRGSFDFDDLVDELAEGTAGEDPASVSIVGESFGGPVAIRFVLAYPERVRTLVLINTFARYRSRVRIRLACRLVPALGWPIVRGLKDMIADRILAAEGIPPRERRHYHATVRMIDPAAYRRRLELVRTVDLVDRLSEIKVPTAILAAGRDKIVPSVVEGRFMASRIPNARLYEFPRAGHALLLTPGFSLANYM
ncbi:MAG: alpha/beta hydrolase [Acidobacteria bacterium]|nr:alpha/beta hydrolase [Acidobacteriota bacterium]